MFARSKMILEMIRFSHTLFALPFALLSAVMCWTVQDSQGAVPVFRFLDLAGIILCMVFARSTAMAFNRIADRRIDPRESTHGRSSYSFREIVAVQCNRVYRF